MLKLKKITKIYKFSNIQQIALKDISDTFRKNELVYILGPGDSGKRTLLNIVGGFDEYTNGNLIIGNISTKIILLNIKIITRTIKQDAFYKITILQSYPISNRFAKCYARINTICYK